MPSPDASAADAAIRPAGDADAEGLSALHGLAFRPLGQTPWPADAFRAILRLPTTAGLVVDRHPPPGAPHPLPGAPMAAIVGQAAGGDAEILTLATRPDMQRQGLARMLLTRLLDIYAGNGISRVFLEVMETNSSAIALYRTAGFNKAGERLKYYRDTIHGGALTALVLVKPLA